MKLLNDHTVIELSKKIYSTNIMLSGTSKSFVKLSKGLIIRLQEGYSQEKLNRFLSTELIVTYGLTIDEATLNNLGRLIYEWYKA